MDVAVGQTEEGVKMDKGWIWDHRGGGFDTEDPMVREIDEWAMNDTQVV